MHLTKRFHEAHRIAAAYQTAQVSRGGDSVYLAHHLAVAEMIKEFGGTEDESIAALLYGIAGDPEGPLAPDQVRAAFGDTVAEIVVACAYATGDPRSLCRTITESYPDALRGKSDSALLVACCEKLRCAHCLLGEYRAHGESFWEPFDNSKAEIVHHYRAMADAFLDHGPKAPAEELAEAVAKLESAAALDG